MVSAVVLNKLLAVVVPNDFTGVTVSLLLFKIIIIKTPFLLGNRFLLLIVEFLLKEITKLF